MPPTVYTYDPHGVLTGSQVAILSPRGPALTWVIPARSTSVAPPAIPAGQKAVFDPDNKVWSLQKE